MSRHIDAALTSGTSPGSRNRRIHLLGAGAVGQALLERISASRHTLVAVTDSTGTAYNASGLDAHAIAAWKRARRSLVNHPSSTSPDWTAVLDRTDADLVIDATPSTPRAGWTTALESHVLERGRALVLIAKTALSENAAAWLGPRYAGRIGCNAVLGGTGFSFVRALPSLQARCTGVAVVGNASTTSIITALEGGLSLSEGIERANQLGYLEPDPELDLRGVDAAVKLAIVAGAIRGRAYDTASIHCEDIRALNPVVLRAASRAGRTTRLIARLHPDGKLNVAYEAVPVDSVLAAPCGRVIYEYDVSGGDRHIYIGEGLGADATAAAAWVDVQSLSRTNRVPAGAL